MPCNNNNNNNIVFMSLYFLFFYLRLLDTDLEPSNLS